MRRKELITYSSALAACLAVGLVVGSLLSWLSGGSLLDDEAHSPYSISASSPSFPDASDELELAGVVFSEPPRAEEQTFGPPIRHVDTAELSGRLSSLSSEKETLLNENARLQVQMNELLNWMLVNYKDTYPMPESYLSELHLPAITDDLLMDPLTADLLEVTEQEEYQINTAFIDTHDTIQQVEAALMTVNDSLPGTVILHVPPYPEEGQVIRENLYASLENTLGGSRLDQLLDMGSTSMEEAFSHFGVAARTMIFEHIENAKWNEPSLNIKDGWVFEEGPSKKTVKLTETLVAKLPKEYQNYEAWLPENFKRSAY